MKVRNKNKKKVKKLSGYHYFSGISGISSMSRICDHGVLEEEVGSVHGVLEGVDSGSYNTELELSPIHFVVKFEGKFYTNVEFTNELRYILRRLNLESYVFTFYMYNTERNDYSVALTTVVNVSIISMLQALDISARLAEVVYKRNIYDKTKTVRLKLSKHVLNKDVLNKDVLELTSSFIWHGGTREENKDINSNFDGDDGDIPNNVMGVFDGVDGDVPNNVMDIIDRIYKGGKSDLDKYNPTKHDDVRVLMNKLINIRKRYNEIDSEIRNINKCGFVEFNKFLFECPNLIGIINSVIDWEAKEAEVRGRISETNANYKSGEIS